MATVDPFVAQIAAQYTAQSQAEAANLKQGVNRSLIDYGAIPDFTAYPGLSQYIDPTTAALAAQNTASGMSQTGQMQHAHTINLRNVQNSLAARGILSSGETPYQFSEEDLRNNQAQYNSTKTLLDYLGGQLAGFASNETQRQLGLIDANQAAAQRAQDLAFQQQQLAAANQAAAQAAASSADTGGGGGSAADYGLQYTGQTDPNGLGIYSDGQGNQYVDAGGGNFQPYGGGGGGAPAAASGPSAWQQKVYKNALPLAAAQRSPEMKNVMALYRQNGWG